MSFPDNPQELRARAERLTAAKIEQGLCLAVVLPAKNEEATISHIVGSVRRDLMERTQLVDELVVIDDNSTDATAEIASDEGANVYAESSILPEAEPGSGKGNAMWKSLHATQSDLVCWLDADIRNFKCHFVTEISAKLIEDPGNLLVKGFYQRPLFGEPHRWRPGDRTHGPTHFCPTCFRN